MTRLTRFLALSAAALAVLPMTAAVMPVEVAVPALHTAAMPVAEAAQAAQNPASQSTANQSDDEWCRDTQRNQSDDDRRETFCEVRRFTLASGPVTANTSNGSIRVTGERRSDVLVRAQVVTYGRTAERARELARAITINQSGTLRADGPRSENREGWHVAFRIQAPQATDLDLTSSNGSLAITDVRGRLKLRTSNGSVNLVNAAGDVAADTSNGSVNVTLAGTKWDGEGLDVSTSNGSVRLTMPDNYNARLVAGTSNGSINVGFPITVSGNIGGRRHDIDTTIGSGGPALRLRTSNGSIRVQRPGASNERDRR